MAVDSLYEGLDKPSLGITLPLLHTKVPAEYKSIEDKCIYIETLG